MPDNENTDATPSPLKTAEERPPNSQNPERFTGLKLHS